MHGYTKLFGSILASTIWREDKETKIVWITMLAMADKDGEVHASIPGLADLARVSIPECESALETLLLPDKYSRTTDFEGRRIEKVDGGWVLLNHAKYREKMSVDERREYLRIKQQESRERRKRSGNDTSDSSTRRQSASTNVNSGQSKSTRSTHTEADTEAKSSSTDSSATAKPGRASETKRVKWDPESGWVGINESDYDRWLNAFPSCDLKKQLSRMDLWLRANPAKAKKSNFYRFVVNWFQREQNRGGDTASAKTESVKDIFS